MAQSIYGLAYGLPIRANVSDCFRLKNNVCKWREKVRHNVREIRTLRNKVYRERDLQERYVLTHELEYKENKLCDVIRSYRKCAKDSLRLKKTVNSDLLRKITL